MYNIWVYFIHKSKIRTDRFGFYFRIWHKRCVVKFKQFDRKFGSSIRKLLLVFGYIECDKRSGTMIGRRISLFWVATIHPYMLNALLQINPSYCCMCQHDQFNELSFCCLHQIKLNGRIQYFSPQIILPVIDEWRFLFQLMTAFIFVRSNSQ